MYGCMDVWMYGWMYICMHVACMDACIYAWTSITLVFGLMIMMG
jgi:hypothetical protein